MKKLLYVGIGLVVLLVLLIGAIFIIPNFVDWNKYKPEISEAARDATGRDLVIAGDIDVGLSLGLELTVMVDGIQLSNPPLASEAPEDERKDQGEDAPASAGDMLRVKRLEATIPVLSLLSDTVRVDSIIVYEPILNLAIDAEGESNWRFEGAAPDAEPDDSEPSRYSDVKFGETRIDDGKVNFDDATTGQAVRATDLNLEIMLESLSEPLVLSAKMVVNDKPVSLNVAIDTPHSLMDGPEATVSFDVESEPGKVSYEGRVLVTPIPGLDGTFAADVPSVGNFLNWLDRPLALDQPDPGPLQVKATFVGEADKVELKEATIKGESLDARASGSLDASGPITKVNLDVKAGFLDVDLYLPPERETKVSQDLRRRTNAKEPKGREEGGRLLAALSNEPLDLAFLKGLEAKVDVNIDGLKTRGYRFGKFAFIATAKDGVLNADLSKFALYGGDITGKLSLDVSGKTLKANTTLGIRNVKVDQLAVAATGKQSVVGVASANVKLATTGSSPRSLVQHLRGRVAFDLGGVSVRNSPSHGISGLNVVLELAGLDKDTELDGHVIYNRDKVRFTATVDPLQRLAVSDYFTANLQLNSSKLKLRYRGKIEHRPAFAAQGELVVDVPSVARTMSWLGSPLSPGTRDPGKLHFSAVITASDDRYGFEKARIDSKSLKAEARGYVDRSTTIPKFDVTVDNLDANFDALFPFSTSQAKSRSPSGASQGWSKKRYDFSGLAAANGKLAVTFKRVRYAGISTNRGQLALDLQRRQLEMRVSNVAFSGGSVATRIGLDAARTTPELSYSFSAKGVEARPFLMQFADFDRIGGTLLVEAEGMTQGFSEYDFVNALNGSGKIRFTNGAIYGINIPATLRKARSLDFSSRSARAEKTDFAELGGSYTIKFGVIDNRDLRLRAPLVRASGSGTASIPRQTLNYRIEGRLVPTLRGQGNRGGEDALAGIAIPAHITGSWSDPKVTIDWQSVIREIASDPTRMANLPGAFAQMAAGMGFKVPRVKGLEIPKIPGSNVSPAELLGGAFDPFAGSRKPKSKPKTEPKSAKPKPKPAPRRDVPKNVDDARKTLEGLFGR